MRFNSLSSLLLAGTLSVTTILHADDSGNTHNFYETSQEIVEALSGQHKQAATDLGKSRSLFGDGETRSLKRKKVPVMQMDAASGKATSTEYETGGELGSANLKIEFDFNSADIRASSRPLLDELGKALGDPALASRAITIAGHTDATGDDAYNQHLSLLRARAVSVYLRQRHDLDTGRMDIIGFGEAMPLVSNDSRSNRQLNRRVEIISR